MGHYNIPENTNYSKDVQEQRDEISSIRVSKVQDYLTDDRPTALPFKISFPIVSDLDYKSFSNLIMRNSKFDDLPEFVKQKVHDAEKVKFFDTKFRAYLSVKNLTTEEFRSKNPKTKLDILYDWLFENKLDIGILS